MLLSLWMRIWIEKADSFKIGYLIICGWLFFGSGCSKDVQISPGLVTLRIEGKIELSSGSRIIRPFVLARKHHRTLIQTATGYLYRVSALIIHPNERGDYTIHMENDVDEVELQIIAAGHRSAQHIFRRTIGIGSYRFNTELKKDLNYRENYYILIKPALSEYITEQRYKMDRIDQMFLSDWFTQVESNFPRNKNR